MTYQQPQAAQQQSNQIGDLALDVQGLTLPPPQNKLKLYFLFVEQHHSPLMLTLMAIVVILPTIYVLVFLWALNFPLGALICYQFTIAAFPCIYIWSQVNKIHIKKSSAYAKYFDSKRGFYFQLCIGVFLAVITCASILGVLYILAQYTMIINFQKLYNLDMGLALRIVCAALLGMSNPHLEGFFWRSFLPLQLGYLPGQPHSITTMLLTNFFYTIYHFPVVLYFVNFVYPAVIATIVLYLGGLVMFQLHERLGPVAANSAHQGADIAFAYLIIASDLQA